MLLENCFEKCCMFFFILICLKSPDPAVELRLCAQVGLQVLSMILWWAQAVAGLLDRSWIGHGSVMDPSSIFLHILKKNTMEVILPDPPILSRGCLSTVP